MKNTTKFIIAGLAFFNISCAISPSPQEIKLVEYGPFPSNAKELTLRYAAEVLKDPASAKYRNWKGPRKVWVKDYLDDPLPTIYGGWAVCFELNAKNSYGGYNGFETWVAILNGDRVVSLREVSYFRKRNVFTSLEFCNGN